MKSPVCALAAVASFALPGWASGELDALTGTAFADAWSAALFHPGAFGRAEAGELTGDGAFDALLLDGNQPVVLVNPDRYSAPLVVPLQANDASVLAAEAASGQSAVAVVGASGLHLAWYEPSDGRFAVALVAGGAWAGAKLVRCAALDTSGGDDVLGVAADGRSVMTLQRTGPASFVPGPTFTALADVLDVLLVQWDGDAQPEVALLTAAGLQVHEQSGVLLSNWSSILPGGTLARVRQAGMVTDRLAWITAYAPPAQQWLLTLSPAGIDGQLDLGGLDVVSSVGADFDADGDDDVLLSHRVSHELVLLVNERSAAYPLGTSFSGGRDATLLMKVGPADIDAPTNAAWPAVADFDGDGDLDVVFAVELTQSVQYVRGDWIDEQSRAIGISSASYDIGVQGELALGLTAPAVATPSATHVEISVHRRAAPGAPMESQGVLQQLVALPAQWPSSVTLALPEVDLDFTAIYDVALRLVELDAAGRLAAVHPTTYASFALRAETVTTLAQASGVAALPVELLVPAPEASTVSPGLVHCRRFDRFAENAPPIPAPQS